MGLQAPAGLVAFAVRQLVVIPSAVGRSHAGGLRSPAQDRVVRTGPGVRMLCSRQPGAWDTTKDTESPAANILRTQTMPARGAPKWVGKALLVNDVWTACCAYPGNVIRQKFLVGDGGTISTRRICRNRSLAGGDVLGLPSANLQFRSIGYSPVSRFGHSFVVSGFV